MYTIIFTVFVQIHTSYPSLSKLAKLSSVIEKLDKKANVVDAIEVFMAFSRWLEYRSQTDPEITPELLKAINSVGTTVVVVTHEHELAHRYAKRIIEIKDGRVVNDTAEKAVTL